MTKFGKAWSIQQLEEHMKKRPEQRVAGKPQVIEPAPLAPWKQGPELGGMYGLPPKNKKIKNATKTVVDGIKFDSKLELYAYQSLKRAGIEFNFQRLFELQPKFRYLGKGVRAITLTVDFWLPKHNVIIDSKGWADAVAPVKYKLLKFKFACAPGKLKMPRIFMPSTKKKIDALVLELLAEKR